MIYNPWAVALSFILIAVPFLVLSIPVLLLAIWGYNKLCPERRIKFWRGLAISVAISVAIIVIFYAAMYWEIYRAGHSKENMDNQLATMEMGIILPDYKVAKHKCVQYGISDIEDSFYIEFKNDSILALIPKLDSLCKEKERRIETYRTNDGDLTTTSKWAKEGDIYVFRLKNMGYLYFETFEINPRKRTATFVHYRY
ncbi:MAG: hypothetical protein J6Y39_07845 [Bacteroidaceae bacterium]|nr:hypothetical protein [Bacteroidaceae bacterium]